MADTRQRPARQRSAEERTPWRVEGHPEGDPPPAGQRPAPAPPSPWRRVWGVLIGLLALNFVLRLALSGQAAPPPVPYTLFFSPGPKGNVSQITPKGREN